MKLDIKTIIGFVVIGVVAYLCRPLNDKIADVFFEDKNDIVDMEVSNEEEIGDLNVSGNIEGHDYVDLGLSVKWATCNIGAAKPKEYGNYELALYPSQAKVKVLSDRNLNEDALQYMMVVLDVVNSIEPEVSEIDLRYGAVSYRRR